MLLEKIAKRATLADGYSANSSLKDAITGYLWYYSIQLLLLAILASFSSIVLESIPALEAINTAVFGAAAVVLAMLLTAYWLLRNLLALASRRALPALSLIVSLICFIVHLALLALILFGALSIALRLFEQTDRVNLSSISALLAALSVSTVLPYALTALVDFVLWLILLCTVVTRSARALRSSFRRSPGVNEYTYGTRVESSTGKDSELYFLAKALRSTGNYTAADIESMLANEENYLLRFAHRAGKMVAASLQERKGYRLIGIFPGNADKSINIAVLLEDSYLIQKRARKEPQAVLSYDQLIEGIAKGAGWKVDQRDSLMVLTYDGLSGSHSPQDRS